MPVRASAGAGVALFLLYLATLAPGLTFWDAGEFISAIGTFGIPHPPGTPLYVALGRAWTVPFVSAGTAYATNLLSAGCTAAAGAILAWLMARWSRNGLVGLAAAICAGAGFTVWASATETEVYAASLLLAMTMVLAGSAASRPGREDPRRATLVLVYLMGLAGPLHPSALLAVPAAITLAAQAESGTDWPLLTLLAGMSLLAAGAALVSPVFAVAGVAVTVGALVAGRRQGRPLASRAAAMLAVLALAATPWLILYLRAQFDPGVNQGNPATLDALLAVIRRDQYLVAPPWPRNAPAWLQLANVAQYADWQFALGIAAQPAVSIGRLAVTTLYVVLGVAGALEHRRLHRAGWMAMSLLLLAGTLGAAAQLNLRAGPTIGYGILPADAPHEPRERDYFFALGFWAWGAWAALGGWRLAARLGRGRPWVLAAVAVLPIVLNWRVANRRGQVESVLPRAFAAALLQPLPRRAVLFVAGDNDTYPLWYLQQVERVRPDVVVVTIPLLGAQWYRAELRRRHGLVDADGTSRWWGTDDAVSGIAERARAQQREVFVDVSVSPRYRGPMGGHWRYWGLVYQQVDRGGLSIDSTRTRAAELDAAVLLRSGVPRNGVDDTAGYIQTLLRCPGEALAHTGGTGVSALLASTCNFR